MPKEGQPLSVTIGGAIGASEWAVKVTIFCRASVIVKKRGYAQEEVEGVYACESVWIVWCLDSKPQCFCQ